MQPRRFDRDRDLPAVAELLGRTRASGGLSHPGGIQWWLRLAGRRENFEAFVWPLYGRLVGFALVDRSFAVIERDDEGPTRLEGVEWLENHMRASSAERLELHVADGDPLLHELVSRGYARGGTELELLADTTEAPEPATLPPGFRMGSLDDVTDEAYIAGHVAAWSGERPSSYNQELHEAVKGSPQFRSDLVTIALAPDGTVAACCIGWLDERSATLEIEPLGTHGDYRRLGLARAIVKEVQRRAWANGAKQALVWNNPETLPGPYRLYTGADMAPGRTLIELSKPL